MVCVAGFAKQLRGPKDMECDSDEICKLCCPILMGGIEMRIVSTYKFLLGSNNQCWRTFCISCRCPIVSKYQK